MDPSKNSDVTNLAMGAVFGIDSSVYSFDVISNSIATLPEDVNSIADFYLVAVRITEPQAGKMILVIELFKNLSF
jgi:hypothetical protein